MNEIYLLAFCAFCLLTLIVFSYLNVLKRMRSLEENLSKARNDIQDIQIKLIEVNCHLIHLQLPRSYQPVPFHKVEEEKKSKRGRPRKEKNEG